MHKYNLNKNAYPEIFTPSPTKTNISISFLKALFFF